MNRILYIAEGEIEGRFINFLKVKDFIQAGRFAKFNLMQDQLKDTDNILARKMEKIFCIIDTDLVEDENITSLIFNLKKLNSICTKVFVLVQNKNFEDELKILSKIGENTPASLGGSSSMRCNDLGKFFRLRHNTMKDLKKYLAQSISYENIVSRDFLFRYCSRPEDFKSRVKNSSKIKVVLFDKCIIN